MWQKIFVLIAIFILLFQVGIASAGSIPMPTGRTCEGSQMPDGTYIPAGQVREVTYGGVRYRCIGCGSCTPISSGSGSNSSTYTPYVPSYGSTSQQMAIGLMGAFLSGFFSTLMSGVFDDNSAYNAQKQRQYEEQQKRLEEEKKKQEERKKQLLAQYNSLLSQAKTQTQTQTNQSNSPFTFQTLGSQLTAFQWQSPSSSSSNSILNTQDENLVTASDINAILGNVIQEKITEKLEEKIDDYGGKIVEKLDKKYGKEWGSKYYEKGLPIIKIAVTAKTEGIASAGAETIDYGISLIPMPTLSAEVSDIGRKIYTKIAFSAVDKFLTQTEKAAEVLGFDFNKDEFMQNFENDMNTGQKIIYKWLKGD